MLTYFTGELGHLNLFILHRLESYNGQKLTIYTFPDYCFIIDNLFPNKFNLLTIPLDKFRICNNSLEDNDYKKKLLPLIDVIGDRENTIREIYEHYFPIYLSKPINSNYKENIDNFICLFPRFRNHPLFEARNFSIAECDAIINKFNNYKIVIVGNEILDYDYKKYNNVIISDNMEKTTFYLKNCKFLISKCSGLIDLAKNCGTKLIFILGNSMVSHQLFNPFNTQTFRIGDNLNLIDNFINMDIILQNKIKNNLISTEDYKQFIIKHIFYQNMMNSIQEYMEMYKLTAKNIWFNPIEKFKYHCYNCIKLYNFPNNTIYNVTRRSVVLFVTEQSQHIEFILKNNINKLGFNWDYYIITFNNNDEYIKQLCKNIDIKLNFINLKFNYILPEDVFNIFSNNNFWKLINNEKILIINEYTLLLNNYKDEYDNYDLIYAKTIYPITFFPFLLINKTNLLNLKIDKNNSLLDNLIKQSNNIAPYNINNSFNLNYNDNYNDNFGSNELFQREWYEDILHESLYNSIIFKGT